MLPLPFTLSEGMGNILTDPNHTTTLPFDDVTCFKYKASPDLRQVPAKISSLSPMCHLGILKLPTGNLSAYFGSFVL